MKRVIPLVLVLIVGPAVSAAATDLDDVLDRSREAAYSAEQMISCATPDGFRMILARVKQKGSTINITSAMGGGEEIATSPGFWSRTGEGGVVEEASIGIEVREVIDIYEVEELGPRLFMGREASGYRLIRDGLVRGELVLDDETGAMVRATTFNDDGAQYCVRSFVTFDPTEPDLLAREVVPNEELTLVRDDASGLPEEVAGFTLLDSYLDASGLRLTYYSDGFFSFAIFQTPNRIELSEAVHVDFEGFRYSREFTPGQVTYAWEVRDQGMAMVGDLPPDLHEAVLDAMPKPIDLGFLHRIWRNLFGPR